ncbi:MAG TPA: hypothetical protein V6C65_12890 [Allocoleopsis sp.]
MRSPESNIRRVSLPKEGQGALLFSSWDQMAESFQQFASEKLQTFHLSASEISEGRKLRRQGKGALVDYSSGEITILSKFYTEAPMTSDHVGKLLRNVKTATDFGNPYTTGSEGIKYGRALYGVRLQIDPLLRGSEQKLYSVAAGPAEFGSRLEKVLEETGAERVSQPKFVRIEYPHQEGKFSIDFADVSQRLRGALQQEDKHLSANSLAHRFDERSDEREKIIDIGNYEGFYLQMHCRHDDMFEIAEGTTLVGKIPKPVEGGWVPPTLDISLVSSGIVKGISAIPNRSIIIPSQRQAAQSFAERIADAFTP